MISPTVVEAWIADALRAAPEPSATQAARIAALLGLSQVRKGCPSAGGDPATGGVPTTCQVLNSTSRQVDQLP